jgi:hypothetical protein
MTYVRRGGVNDRWQWRCMTDSTEPTTAQMLRIHADLPMYSRTRALLLRAADELEQLRDEVAQWKADALDARVQAGWSC